MTVVDHDAAAVGEPDEGTELGTDRRSFLRLGAFTAAATAAAGVAGVATAGSAEAANGSNFLIGSTANSASATTQLSGGSSVVVVDGDSYVISTGVFGGLVATQANSGSVGVYGKDTSSLGATGVRGDGSIGVQGRTNVVSGVGVYGTSSNSSTTGGAIGVQGLVSNLFDIAVWGQHDGGGTAVYGVTTTGTGGYLRASDTGTGAYLASQNGAALQIGASGLTTVPPTTGNWSAGQVLMKNGALYYCWRSGSGTAAKWVRMSGALVPLATPKRAYDSTKSGGAIAAGSSRTITVAKSSTSTPVGVNAAALSITVLKTTGSGFITAYSAAAAAPSTRTLSWWGGKQVHTTSTIVRLDANGKIKIKANKSKTHVIVDVLGYYP